MENENTFMNRVEAIQKRYGLADNALAAEVGIASSTMNGYKSGRSSKIPVSFAMSILENHPEISSDWLLRGEGDMIKNVGINGSNVVNGNVGGDVNQHLTTREDSSYIKRKIELMMKGCVSREDFEFVLKELIEKI